MIALAIYLGLAILIMGSDVAAIQGRWAERLDLPGSGLIPYAPLVALAFFVLAVFAIMKFKVRWRRTSFIAAYLLANFIIAYPFLLLELAVSIPVGGSLDRESKRAFEEKYPVKWSSNGRSVFVRREDYSPELAAFVTGLVAHQPKRGR